MDEIKWRLAFMEVALRAFRKLHIEYGMWGLGQVSDNIKRWEKLNIGHGIELALETAVCAGISQEFINSPFTNGTYMEPGDKMPRTYEIDREVKINGKQIDLFINRYKKENGIEFYKFPVIIEAKRAYYFAPDISTGERGTPAEQVDTEKGLKYDLDKLRTYRTNIQGKQYSITANGYANQDLKDRLNDAFLYHLIWGVYSENSNSSMLRQDPVEFVNKIEAGLIEIGNQENYVLKWMPLKWDDSDVLPKVNEWLWVILVEVDHKKIGKPDKDNPDHWFEKSNKVN